MRAGANPGHAPSRQQLTRDVWAREMNRLRVGARVLLAVLLALLARVIISGVNAALALTGAVLAVLLGADLLLLHRGRRLEPPARRRA